MSLGMFPESKEVVLETDTFSMGGRVKCQREHDSAKSRHNQRTPYT